jgi:hypothetical protein
VAEKLIGLVQLDDRKRQRRKVSEQKSSHSDVNLSKLNPLRSPKNKEKRTRHGRLAKMHCGQLQQVSSILDHNGIRAIFLALHCRHVLLMTKIRVSGAVYHRPCTQLPQHFRKNKECG